MSMILHLSKQQNAVVRFKFFMPILGDLADCLGNVVRLFVVRAKFDVSPTQNHVWLLPWISEVYVRPHRAVPPPEVGLSSLASFRHPPSTPVECNKTDSYLFLFGAMQ